MKSNNKKLLLTISWPVSLLFSGISLAVDASMTYIPGKWAIVGYWVSVATGKRVAPVYDVVKEGSGTNPIFMFFIIILMFAIYSLVFAGSVATGRNMAHHATKIPLKILSFLTWFLGCFCSGVATAGFIPVFFSEKEQYSIRYIAQHEDICNNIFNSVSNYCFPQIDATTTITFGNQPPMMKK